AGARAEATHGRPTCGERRTPSTTPTISPSPKASSSAERLRSPLAPKWVPVAHSEPRSPRSADAPQQSQAARDPDLIEQTALQRRQVDPLVRRTTTVGRIGKDIVDGQCPSDCHVPAPAFVVESGGLLAVTSVDEQHRQ